MSQLSFYRDLSAHEFGDLFGEPRGIRRYQPGDKAARIHQPASARSLALGRGFQVRAYDPPGFHPDRSRVVFHSYAREGEIIRLDRFDRALSLAAGTLAHLHSSQTKVTFQADFTNWKCFPCEDRSQYIECLALLAKAGRSSHTDAQGLGACLESVPKDEQLIILSDSPSPHWLEFVPPTHESVMVINIQQVRYSRPDIQFQPAQSA